MVRKFILGALIALPLTMLADPASDFSNILSQCSSNGSGIIDSYMQAVRTNNYSSLPGNPTPDEVNTTLATCLMINNSAPFTDNSIFSSNHSGSDGGNPFSALPPDNSDTNTLTNTTVAQQNTNVAAATSTPSARPTITAQAALPTTNSSTNSAPSVQWD